MCKTGLGPGEPFPGKVECFLCAMCRLVLTTTIPEDFGEALE